MLNKSLLIVFLALAFLAVPVLSDSTQQYNKIYLSPYALGGMSANTNYTFNVTIDPPDHIGSVVSAVVTFQAYITSSTNFTLWVNNQTCNTKSSFIQVGNEVHPTFDCSNVITSSGKYVVTFRSTQSATSPSGTLDLVYMNNPKGQVKYFGGTDYWQGEIATVFLQLNDANGAKVNNAACVFDLYNTSNILGTPIFKNQPMLFQGDDGIYYYQFSTTNYPQGVYPVDAVCSYVFDNFYYWSQSIGNTINTTINTGTFISGNPLVLNFFDDSVDYIVQSASTGNPRLSNVTYRFDNISANITQLDFYWLGEGYGSTAGSTVTWYALNKTSNTYNIIIGSFALTTTATFTGQDTLFTARVPLDAVGNNVSLQMVGNSGSATIIYGNDWMTLKAFKNTSYVSSVQGGSEVHIYSMNITNAILNGSTFSQQNNAILLEINGTTHETNLTTHQNQVILTQINVTVDSILSLAQSINLTSQQILLLAQNLNLTAQQILQLSQAINQTSTQNNAYLQAINLTSNQNSVYLNTINQTSTQNNVYLNTINQTTTSTNLLALNLTSLVNSISAYLNGFITNILLSINSTVTAINGKNFTPTIIVNLTENETTNVFPTFNVSFNGTVNTVVVVNLTENETTNVFPTFNLTTNVTNVTVVVNTTNTTVVVNTTQVNLNNITVVENITNITVVVNTTNTTVVVNATNLTELTGIAQDINLTGYKNAASIEKINDTVLEINTTTQATQSYLLGFVTASLNNIYAQTNFTVTYLIDVLTPVLGDFQTLLTNINNTVTAINARDFSPNITVNVTVNLTVNTTQVNLNNITVVENITNTTVVVNVTNTTVVVNTTNTSVDFTPVLGAIEEVNQTTRANNAILQNLSLTTPQILGLLQYVNQTFEVKLDNINSSANSLLNITGEINGTAGAIFSLLQQMNLTQQQIYLLVLSNSNKLDQNINLTNQTLQNTVQIVVLASQINSTTVQILGELQNLSISVNNTFTGNVTFNANLSSSTLSDISERVWLQFLTLGTPPLLHSTSYACIAPNTLAINNTFTVQTSSGSKQYTKLDTQYCQYGCDTKTQACISNPPDRLGMISIIVGGILVFIGLVIKFV